MLFIWLAREHLSPQTQNHAQNDSADDTDDTDDTLKELVQSEPPKRPPAYDS